MKRLLVVCTILMAISCLAWAGDVFNNAAGTSKEAPVSVINPDAAKIAAQSVKVEEPMPVDSRVIENPLDNQGGPDPYGYKWMDNVGTDTAQYSWIELNDGVSGATRVTTWSGTTDDGNFMTALSFNFPFYATSYAQVYIGTNGRLQFGGATNGSPYNSCIPMTTHGPTAFIYGRDLKDAGTSTKGVWFKDFGTHFIVEWDSVPNYFSSGNGTIFQKFEAIIFPDGKIKTQYKFVNATATNNVPSVGIQMAASSTSSLQYYCGSSNTPVANKPAAGRAVWFFIPPVVAHDYGTQAITSPGTIRYDWNVSIPVTATFKNYGSTTEPATIKYQFNGGAIETGATSALAQGATETVTFAANLVTPAVNGSYLLDVWVEVAGDADASNDHKTMQVNVYDCSVGKTIPYCENFDAVTLPALPMCWAIANVDADDKYWYTSTSGHTPNNSIYINWKAPQLNDWLFTPALALTGGVTYQLKFWVKVAGSYTERWDIMFGAAQNVAGMTETIVSAATFNNSSYAQVLYTFTPSATGNYYIGWHATSEDALGIYMDDVCVDVAPSTGRCCYQDAPHHYACADNLEPDCQALGGTWSLGLTCTADPCTQPVQGEACDWPYEITSLPYTHDGTTCGYVNDFDYSPNYDSGPDVLYQFVVTTRTCITIDLVNVTSGAYPGLWLFNGCPSPTNIALANAGASSGPLSIGCTELQPGTYYIMVDNWPSPACVTAYTLNVNACTCPLTCDQYVLCGSPAEIEPNDACPVVADQTVLVCDGSVYGLLCPSTDVDLWKVVVPPYSKMTVGQFDGDGCATTPTTCIKTQPFDLNCVALSGTAAGSAGWNLTNSNNVPWEILLKVTAGGACSGPYKLTATCCPLANPCDNVIEVPYVMNYTQTVNTCPTDPCGERLIIPAVYSTGCTTGSVYGSGPAKIFKIVTTQAGIMTITSDALSGDAQLMVFSNCADPAGSCLISLDASGDETATNLSVPAGTWYVAIMLYSSAHTACGEMTLTITSDVYLPVALRNDLVAEPGNGEVNLSWATASETDNARFEIVRNGVVVGTVDGLGTSATGRNYTYTDNGLNNGTSYSYTLRAVTENNTSYDLGTVNAVPTFAAGTVTEYALHQNYPNPFNPATSLAFDLIESGFVTLKVFNVMGQQVATLVNDNMEHGRHIVNFDATNLPSGLYIARLDVNGFVGETKMLLMK